jgi:hypothetical protein
MGVAESVNLKTGNQQRLLLIFLTGFEFSLIHLVASLYHNLTANYLFV